MEGESLGEECVDLKKKKRNLEEVQAKLLIKTWGKCVSLWNILKQLVGFFPAAKLN